MALRREGGGRKHGAEGVSAPRIGLALSGGGARGFAHLSVMEALDDLGIVPSHVTGTSIGAVIGAPYCAGLTANEIRREILDIFRSRTEVVSRLMRAQNKRLGGVLRPSLSNPLQIDAERLLSAFLPDTIPEEFAALKVPFTAVAADFYGSDPVNFETGPLRPAIAASMAIPAIFRPVVFDGRILVDGGIVDPLPTEALAHRAEIVVAVDVIKGPRGEPGKVPNPLETILGSTQLMMQTIVQGRVANRPPDILLRPNIRTFRILDFFKARAILKAAEPAREEAKREIAGAIERYEKRRNR